MGFLDGIKDLGESEGLIHLAHTTIITPLKRTEIVWDTLFFDYQTESLSQEKACMVSLINAVLTHGRRYFVLTRDGAEKIVREDANWPAPPAFNTKKWKMYLYFLIERNVVRKVNSEGRISVYEFVFQPLLQFVPDNENHKKMALEFAERYERRFQRESSEKVYVNESKETVSKVYTISPETREQIRSQFKFDFNEDDFK